MAFFSTPPTFVPNADGTFDLNISDDDRVILRESFDRLRHHLLADDPSLRRLFPNAYTDDPARDDEYQRLMHGELVESRFVALDTLEASLTKDTLTEGEMTAWMQATNAMRLSIGTEIGIDDDDVDPRDFAPDDERLVLLFIYNHLTVVLYELVEALSTALPEPNAEPPGL